MTSFSCIIVSYVNSIFSLFRLLPYGCISTGARVGFIECVTQCETIANIQKNYRRSGPKLSLWDSNLLYQYLKEKNPLEAQ